MNLEIELPDFITPLMKKWLTQLKTPMLKEITIVGLFHWGYRPNKRKPEKPTRIPRLDENQRLFKSNVSREIYFLEIDRQTLHVYQNSGFSLAGSVTVKEFVLENNTFKVTKILFSMIK